MLDEQAKKDLLHLYNELAANNSKIQQVFWDILECAGCAEEMKSTIEDMEEEKQNKKIAREFEELLSSGKYLVLETQWICKDGKTKWISYLKDMFNHFYTVEIHNGCDIEVLKRHGIKVDPF